MFGTGAPAPRAGLIDNCTRSCHRAGNPLTKAVHVVGSFRYAPGLT
jgi:hypothetical protein